GRARGRRVAKERTRHQSWILFNRVRSVGRHVLWAFGRRRWLLARRAGRGGIARVLGHQTLLERLMCRGGLGRGRTSWQERQAKQTESDLDLHWTRKLYWRRFYSYHHRRRNCRNRLHSGATR